MKRRPVSLLILAVLFLTTAAPSPGNRPPPRPTLGERLVAAARAHLGKEYRLGGRQIRRLPGIDCQGLVFLAYTKVTGKSWRKLSVFPYEEMMKEQLGAKVPGLECALVPKIDYPKLRPGDVIHLIGHDVNPKGTPVCRNTAGEDMYVWHMGMYTGGPERKWINADWDTGVVEESSLAGYITKHAEWYQGLVATRLK